MPQGGFTMRAARYFSGVSMEYLHASANALGGLFTLSAMIGLAVGILWGLVVSFMPGVGGNVAIALLLPFIFRLQVPEAIALLLGTHIATYFGGSITSITMNIPASAKSVSLCWDGYPLARRGKGAYALGASATASSLGGVVGAIVLTIGIPVMKNLLNVISNPEIFMLGIWGIVIIAMFSSGDLLKGVMAGGLGMLVSWIGASPITGINRLTFGSQYLSYGITFASAAMGLFAVAQAIRLMAERPTGPAGFETTGGEQIKARGGEIVSAPENTTWHGARAVLKRWRLTTYMATFGVFTGAIPGLGAPVAAIAAYGQAAQFSKGEKLGTGVIEGVIAPQATEAAAEGGGMLPMLALGIPTHEQQAILLSAFIVLGIAPGPTMLTNHLNVVFTVIWIIVFASLIVGLFGLATGKYLARLATMPTKVLVPLILTIGMVGTFAINGRIGDSVTALAFGLVGYIAFKYNYSRVNLIIGLVLGPILESNLHISLQLYGSDFIVRRPAALGIGILVVATIVWWIVRSRVRSSDALAIGSDSSGTTASGWGAVATACGLTVVFAVALVVGLGYGPLTGRILVGVAAVCLVLSLINLPVVTRQFFAARAAAGAGAPSPVEVAVGEGNAALTSPASARTGSGTLVDQAGEALLRSDVNRGAVGTAVGPESAGPEPGHQKGTGSLIALATERHPRTQRAGRFTFAELRASMVAVAFLVSTLVLGLVVGAGAAVMVYRIGTASRRTVRSVMTSVLAGVIASTLVAVLLRTLISEYIPYEGIFSHTSFYIGA